MEGGGDFLFPLFNVAYVYRAFMNYLFSCFKSLSTGLQHDVILAPEPYGLSLDETIMPQYLNKLGYSSHMVGKVSCGINCGNEN